MLKALEDRIILSVEEDKEEVSSSGLILQSAKEIKKTGTVVVVGPGRLMPNGIRLEPDVAVGDKIVFNPMATQDVEHDGVTYKVIFSKDVLAIIEGE